LANQSHPFCAQRQSDRHFLLSTRGPGQEQIGHIADHQQQQQNRRCGQERNSGRNAA